MGVVDTTIDGEVLGCVHGVVLHGISLNVATVDGQRCFAFNAFAAFVLRLGAIDGDIATVDGQVALGFDAFRVGVVAATAWPSTATAGDGDALARSGHVEVEVVVVGALLANDEGATHVDAFAARARAA